MDSFLGSPYAFETWPFVFLALMIAFTFHEFAHAYFAYKFGDPTAHSQGRVSLNPRVHLDILGTILIFIAGFGWAKPVPVNRSYFKKPRLMSIIVSAAGPLSNLVIAFVGLLLLYLFSYLNVFEGLSKGVGDAVLTFFTTLIILNIRLFIFNLIPLPPLDGYRIIEDLSPQRIRIKLAKYEQWAIFIFLLMVFIPPISRVTIGPIFQLSNVILIFLNSILSAIFGFSLL
jgi:Zn-dependent protease